ncbi:anti-sigma factor antagonist [Actinoplanes sp. KI2]|uniref:anti-sigma factor antagonist n=1 Tax=Actinoplanes sp. KI2 TaxID=2983315 RepID=UPI0021D5B16F|nr:anti-sigma factor antagonist [Actinoplanes sp. KI2]MCU7729564.1 anti-sigma factor antagonist [Actinoplanes sp. KI2]
MDIQRHVVDSIMVISLAGDLDGRFAATVQEEVLRSLPRDERILLDLTSVPFVSSAGLRTMLLIYRQAQVVNSSVALVGLSAELSSVLSATGFLGFFVVADTVAEGVRALNKSELKRSSLT